MHLGTILVVSSSFKNKIRTDTTLLRLSDEGRQLQKLTYNKPLLIASRTCPICLQVKKHGLKKNRQKETNVFTCLATPCRVQFEVGVIGNTQRSTTKHLSELILNGIETKFKLTTGMEH